MKKLLTVVVLFLAVLYLPAAIIEIETVEKRSFKVNEEVTFKLTGWAEKDVKLTSGTVDVQLSDSGMTKLGKPLTFDFSKGNPQTFTAKLTRPGFILATPRQLKTVDGKTVNWQKKSPPIHGGAAVEPEKITAGGERPADFDKFWADGIKAYQNAKVEVTPEPGHKMEGYKVFRIKVDFIDNSGLIDGFLSIPEKPGKYPAVVAVPGAGVGQIRPLPMWHHDGLAINLMMNVHPFATKLSGKQQAKSYNDYNNKFPEKRYFIRNAENRDEYVYRKVWLAFNRAIDYVASLKEFDGKHLAITGNSQGGGTALAVGSMNKHVSCIIASVPALCDHAGWKAGRRPGWPLLNKNLKGKADAAAAYFDCAFFADNIKVPVLVSVGYVDPVCSPSSVYAAYNRIKSSKKIYPAYRGTHTNEPEFFPMTKEFLKQEFSK